MSICPFWSVGKNKIICNDECPMNPINNNGIECIFLEEIINKDLLNDTYMTKDEFLYNHEDSYKELMSVYKNY